MAFIDGHIDKILADIATVRKLDNPLPPPGPEWEGVMVTHNEEKTDVHLCILNSGGTYEWVKIGEST